MAGFFDSFLGRSQRRDIDRGFDYSTRQIGQAQDTVKSYGDRADSYWRPYAERGEQASGVYADSLGLNGEAGGQNALATYRAGRNPHLQFEQDEAQRGIDAAANARGMVNSGMNATAAAYARQKLGYQDYAGWQDRINGVSQQGMQAAGQRSGIAMNTGNALAGLYQTQAGNGIQYSNALASNRNVGVNNLMGLGGTALKASGVGGYAPAGRGGGTWQNPDYAWAA